MGFPARVGVPLRPVRLGDLEGPASSSFRPSRLLGSGHQEPFSARKPKGSKKSRRRPVDDPGKVAGGKSAIGRHCQAGLRRRNERASGGTRPVGTITRCAVVGLPKISLLSMLGGFCPGAHGRAAEVEARSDPGQTQEVRFAADSPLEGDGFEPSAFYPESSVSAAFRTSVAANLHPYNALLCTSGQRTCAVF